ncbi:hypothetical protein MKK65_14195 [Methylobacterium sp. J-001]|uniref:hypothetical protein n=1 Tax=Methylobacterium sp. J-001 TaxID=2836609 RepID=UPI001FBBEA10|nr:hypothetical protein [Methylobacterium sp. J-001]MCJ2117700.1 hypothetical protein [Methylobacterium sp. J-001]
MRVLIAVTHFLGAGHLTRAAAVTLIAAALRASAGLPPPTEAAEPELTACAS